jgi:UDP-N-acetylmuramoylalanine--D-glutamate ligase
LNKERRASEEARGPKVEVRGKRALVVGLARSGRAAARALQRHGAVITVTDSRPPAAFAAEIPDLLSGKIGLELGLHRQHTFLQQDFIVVSPGIPGDLAQLVAARQHNVRIVPEIEAASWFLRGRLVGVTGSNGKTTTTTLLGRMLEASGFDTFVGGNTGVPLISVADQTGADSISVAELSSFQLEATRDFRVHVAVLLNITPNHLDRHASFDAYVAAKAGIFRNQTGKDWAVLNADDPTVMSFLPALSSRKVLFSLRQDLPDGVLVSNGKILYRVGNLERVLMDVADVKLRGAFNLENVVAAAAAACVLGADFEVLPQVVRDFRGVEHRLEYVRQIRGVDFYNDSKATSVDATVKALSAFEHPETPSGRGGVHLILGGKDKGAPYGPLRPLVERRAREVLLIGAAADQIAKELAGAAELVRAGDLETAVREAFRAAVPGDTILLAPACASFDQFQDFEHRGRVFKEVVERLATELETGNSELQIRNSKLAPGLRRPLSRVSNFEFRVSNQQSTISNQQSAMAEPRVLSRPELVYVYEVAAEELAPMEGELSSAPGGTQSEVYEEFDLLRPLPADGPDYEPLLYEVSVASRGGRGQEPFLIPQSREKDARPAPAGGEIPRPRRDGAPGLRPTDAGTGSQPRGSLTASDSGAEASEAQKFDLASGGGSSLPGSGQGSLFEDKSSDK